MVEEYNGMQTEITTLTPDVKNGTNRDIITSSSQNGSEDLVGDAWGDGDGLLD